MHLDEESYEKSFYFVENQCIKSADWALFFLAYCKQNVWGAVIGHILARFCLFSASWNCPKGGPG